MKARAEALPSEDGPDAEPNDKSRPSLSPEIMNVSGAGKDETGIQASGKREKSNHFAMRPSHS